MNGFIGKLKAAIRIFKSENYFYVVYDGKGYRARLWVDGSQPKGMKSVIERVDIMLGRVAYMRAAAIKTVKDLAENYNMGTTMVPFISEEKEEIMVTFRSEEKEEETKGEL